MRQVSDTASSHRESYYDYMVRMSREEDIKNGIDNRPDRALIRDLENRVKQLEIDMAHVLEQK